MTPTELQAYLAVARHHGVTSLAITTKDGECLKVDLAPVAAAKPEAQPATPPTMGDLLDVYGAGIPTDG